MDILSKPSQSRPRSDPEKNFTLTLFLFRCFYCILWAGRGLTRQPSSTVERTPSVDRRDGLCPVYGTHKLGGLPKCPKTPKKPPKRGSQKPPKRGRFLPQKRVFRNSLFDLFWKSRKSPWKPQRKCEKTFSCAFINPTKIASAAPDPGGR